MCGQRFLEFFPSEWLNSPLPFSKEPLRGGKTCSSALFGTTGLLVCSGQWQGEEY